MQTRHKKRSYSSFYKIYRRLRFIRYKKKLLKRHDHAFKQKVKQDLHDQTAQMRDFMLSERKSRLIKQKAEREEARKFKLELKKEIALREKLARQEWESLTHEDRRKLKQAASQEKKARKLQRRQGIRNLSKNFQQSFHSINLKSVERKLKAFRDSGPSRRKFFLISFNSTILFLLSYLSLFLVSQAITVLAAQFFDYPATVYYYEIYFNIGQESWFHDSVKTIYSSGPLLIFVIGISMLIIYSNLKENPGVFKLFFLWGFLHSVNMLFGALLIGTLFDTGVGYVISWMYVMDTGKLLYSIISIFLLVIAGLIATRPLLISGNTYYNEINEGNRTTFIIAQVIMPYLAGNAFLLIIRQPRFVFYDTFIALTIIISIIPILVTYRTYHELYFEEEEKMPQIAWKPIVVLVILVLIFRGLLGIGLHIDG
jgi:hypothetical protein